MKVDNPPTNTSKFIRYPPFWLFLGQLIITSGLYFQYCLLSDNGYLPFVLNKIQQPWIQWTGRFDSFLRNSGYYSHSVVELICNFTLHVLAPCLINLLILSMAFQVILFFRKPKRASHAA